MKSVLLGAAFACTAHCATAAIFEYHDFGDILSATTTSDQGAAIDGSVNFTENGEAENNNGSPGLAVSFFFDPMTFTGISAYEVGLIFGNDENGCCGSTGVFDAKLSAFAGATLLGSVTVQSNGNDLEDQFIGLGSTTAFDRIELSYGADSGFLSLFIDRIDLGYDAVYAAVPVPPGLPLLFGGLGLLSLLRRRHLLSGN